MGCLASTAFLVFFLFIVVQTCMVVQSLASRRLRALPVARHVSRGFKWPSWVLGLVVGSFVGGLLSAITPFIGVPVVVYSLLRRRSG